MSSRSSPDHRDPREAAAQEQRHRLAQGLGALDVDDVGARHHHLAHGGVAELEDRVDHLALVGLDQARGLGEVDHLAQLGLGGERALGEALAGRERVADQDQQPRQRAEHPAEAEHGAGARPARSPRRAGGRGCAGRRRPPRTSTTNIRPIGGEHRGPAVRARAASSTIAVASTTAEVSASSRTNEHGVEVARRVVEQPQQAYGAGPLLVRQLERAGAGERRERRLDGGQRGGEHDQRHHQQDQARTVSAHLWLTPVRTETRSASWPTPLAQEPGLEAEHLLVLLGLGVVVAEQVQDAVHGEQVELVGGAVAGGLRPAARRPPGTAPGRRARPPRAPR